MCLCRGGSNIYSREIARHFPKETTDILISKQASVKYDMDNVLRISTFSSHIEMLLKTFFIYPFILLKWFPALMKYETLYIPQQGIWDFGFIFIFKLLGKKVVNTVHDSKLHFGESSFLMSILLRLRYNLSNNLIFLTDIEKSSFFELYKQEKWETAVIPHGIFKLPGIDIRPVTNSRNILFLGRIIKYKGVDLLIEVADEIEDEIDELVIGGEANYNLRLPKSSKVKIINKFLSETEMVKLLNQSDIIVLPYLEATQSGVVTLAINSAIPTILTNVGGLVEQLAESEAIFIEPNSKEQLKKAIVSLLNNSDKRKQLKNKLLLKKDSLSWEKISQDIYNFIYNF